MHNRYDNYRRYENQPGYQGRNTRRNQYNPEEHDPWKFDNDHYMDLDADEAYGGRGEDRDFRYEFERGSRRGYQGMSNRELSDRYDPLQRYSSKSSQEFRGDEFSDQPYSRGSRNFDYSRGSENFDSQRNYGSYPSSSLPMEGRGQFAGRGPKGYSRSDERVTEDINEQLMRHPDVDASDIEVKVNGGEVILTGTVTQRHCKRMAEDIAERISGVKDVRNEIRVQAQSNYSQNAGMESSQSKQNGEEKNRNKLSQTAH